jgi:DNA ligase (NAD+)
MHVNGGLLAHETVDYARRPVNAPETQKAIERLAEQIRHHRDRYYNDEPEISDAEFDALEDRLRALAPDHPVLAEVGAPVKEEADDAEALSEAKEILARTSVEKLAAMIEAESARFYLGKESEASHYKSLWVALEKEAPGHVAFERSVPPPGKEWQKAPHEIPMGSLNKVNSKEELADWAARCDELGAKGELPKVTTDLAMTEKLDGISIELLYADGRFENAITRGDGLAGERITPNAAHMQGVPAEIDLEGRVSVRGEVILRKSDAKRFTAFKKKVDKRFTELKSLRNAAAGIARTKEPKLLPGCKFLSILIYDVEGVPGLATEKEKLELIQRLGFQTPSMSFGDLSAIQRAYDEYQSERRERLDYDIDGLVVRANDVHTWTLLGELNNRPRAAVAFKFGNEMQVTQLDGILWSTGDSGRITPIAQIQPVFLAGAEVRQASLHNLSNVVRLGIGPGDQVLVSRRNDVIPYVEKVVVKGDAVAAAPESCAVCGAPPSVEGEYLMCRNGACPAVQLGRVKTWIKHLGLLEWGDKTFYRLWEEGLVKEVADLYRLRIEDVAALEGYGEVSAKKLIEPLAGKKKLPMATFIAALGIESVSKETAKLLVAGGYDSFQAIAEATVEELSAIEGLGAIKAERIIGGMKARLEETRRLAELGVEPVTKDESGPLAGLSFCFSGSHSRPRKVLQGCVEKNGGSVASAVTKGVTYLVLADATSTSSKAQKARKLGTEIIDEAQFDAIVSERGGVLD